jgi:hypothetical protein
MQEVPLSDACHPQITLVKVCDMIVCCLKRETVYHVSLIWKMYEHRLYMSLVSESVQSL